MSSSSHRYNEVDLVRSSLATPKILDHQQQSAPSEQSTPPHPWLATLLARAGSNEGAGALFEAELLNNKSTPPHPELFNVGAAGDSSTTPTSSLRLRNSAGGGPTSSTTSLSSVLLLAAPAPSDFLRPTSSFGHGIGPPPMLSRHGIGPSGSSRKPGHSFGPAAGPAGGGPSSSPGSSAAKRGRGGGRAAGAAHGGGTAGAPNFFEGKSVGPKANMAGVLITAGVRASSLRVERL